MDGQCVWFTCYAHSHNRTCFCVWVLIPQREAGVHPLSRAALLTHIWRNMAAGLLFLVCAGAVLYSAQAQDSYNGLPDYYKKGVDLALEQLNTHAGVHHHFRFLRSVEKSDIEVKAGDFIICYLINSWPEEVVYITFCVRTFISALVNTDGSRS